MKNGKELYKIVPYYVEKRGNLKMAGIFRPVEYKIVRDILVVHVKEEMHPTDMELLTKDLQNIFGEPLLLFATNKDVSFFIAAPMSEKEVRDFEKGKKAVNSS